MALNAIDGPSDAPTTQPLSIFTRGGGVESAGAAGGVVAAGGASARGVSAIAAVAVSVMIRLKSQVLGMPVSPCRAALAAQQRVSLAVVNLAPAFARAGGRG